MTTIALIKKSFSDTVLLLDRFDFDSDGNKPRTSKTNTQYKELSVQTKHYNYDDDSAFEKDLFVAVISEENDTGKETIGILHNIVIYL